MLPLIVAGLWGYLLGAIPVGVIVARVMTGVDVHSQGSRHTGGTNVARAAGWRGGALTVVCDILLGAAAVGGARLLSENPWAATVAGVMAIIGHDWSVFIGFEGGIGLSDLAGATLAMNWLRALGGGGAFILVWLFLTKVLHRHKARSTIFAILIFPVALWLLRMSPPGVALGALGTVVVVIKTLPDWHRVYT